MALRLKVLLTSLSSLRQYQTRGTPAATRILNSAVSEQSRKLSTAEPPSYEEFNVQDKDDFIERVLKSPVPIMVDFHASWCKPCHALAPRLQEVISERPGRVQLAKIDVDEHGDLAMEYDVSSIPKVIMFKEGKVAGEFIGLMEKDKIESFVDRLTL
ncbi:thioredoxin, mitochondrial-like [Asterias rubens]|uniref:thioredoxin, mitochondrial-like n=1 Tax=Asterias rubens TaxID=7604 RepID=UPI001455394B|nr:thioredoxin, mitochondrial-like [Asterias rubens]